MTVLSTWGGRRPGAGREGVHLKPSEALLIVDALNGCIIEPTLAEQQIAWEVEEAINLDRLDEKWNVNGKNLVKRLRRLTHAQALDLLEKINLFWSEYHVPDAEQRVQDVGLATREPTR